jgi:hypothetical protein
MIFLLMRFLWMWGMTPEGMSRMHSGAVHASARDGGLDERVELLVSTDGELQMAGSDTLHLQILGGVSGKLKHLLGETRGLVGSKPQQ